MISLKPQSRVPMDPTETFYFLGTWSDRPMSKCKCAFPCGGTDCGPTAITHSMALGGTATGRYTVVGVDLSNGEDHSVVSPMTQEEMDRGPLPEWAAVDVANGELVLGAQLPTRDGRRCGNAHITEIEEGCLGTGKSVYTVLTDAGSFLLLYDTEIWELFHPPIWVSDVNDVIRKFGGPTQ